MEENKVYELSLSQNYVSNWDVYDAVREILQNAIDSDKDGHEMKVEYDGASILRITNDGASLDATNLVLGGGDKTGNSKYIGGFSEGLKIALLVLLRNYCYVEICNDDLLWTPCFEQSEVFDCEVLKIKESEQDATNKLEIIIYGIDSDLFDKLSLKFLCIEDDYGDYIETGYGKILKDKKYKGQMFVGGLYIQKDDSFEFGYDFNPEVVRLDRDRKAVNYYELLDLTSKSMITSKECDMNVFSAINKSSTDCKRLIDFLDEANDDFLKEYHDHYYEEKNLDEDTIVATKEVGRYLSREGYEVAEGTEIESYLLAKYKNNVEVIENTKSIIKESSKELTAWTNLNDTDLLRLIVFVRDKLGLSNFKYEFIDKFIISGYDLRPYYFNEIEEQVIKDFDIIDEEYVQAKIDELKKE